MQTVRRGYVAKDELEFFQKSSYALLKRAQEDLLYLMEQSYPIKSASTFVGNHYMLSERQRLAVVRATATREIRKLRKEKEFTTEIQKQTVHIDGFNLIITLEVALSESTLILCMDGTIRDLAGLRGTYKLIDKTDMAILLIGKELEELEVERAVFYLDSPVSNSGRLKTRILELLDGFSFQTEVILVPNADVILENESMVITSDAIILNKCRSWINILPDILKRNLRNIKYVDLSHHKPLAKIEEVNY